MIKAGDTVYMHYKGSLEDGTVFDNSEGREPLQFTAGGDELIPGMSNAVIGMDVGEKKIVHVTPEEGYGPRREELVLQVPRAQLPEGSDVGAVLGLDTPQGTLRVTLTGFDGKEATLDGNHFLAGKSLIFEIEVTAFQPAG